MTAFDKAREIVATWNEKKRVALDGAIEVARALLAYEPTPDAKTEAAAILAAMKTGCAFEPCTLPPCKCADDIASAITAAVAASEARVRAETIEECARVAKREYEREKSNKARDPKAELGGVAVANVIWIGIRALGGAR